MRPRSPSSFTNLSVLVMLAPTRTIKLEAEWSKVIYRNLREWR